MRAAQSCNRNSVRMPFSGMVKCGCCGSGFSRRTAGKYRRWGCNTRERKGRESCDSRPIKEEELGAAVRTVMEKDDFDAAELRRKVSKIVIHNDCVEFHLTNGRIKKTARSYTGQRGSNPRYMDKGSKSVGLQSAAHEMSTEEIDRIRIEGSCGLLLRRRL